MSWVGPAEELESICEEPAPEGAGEEQAPEGAGEEQAPEGAGEEQAPEGAGEEQALGLGSKPSPHNPLTGPGAPGGSGNAELDGTSGDEDKLGGTIIL